MTLIVTPIDTETTGLCEPEHRIIELYYSHWDFGTRQRLSTYHQRIDPKRSITPDAQRVHGISVTDLIGKPDWESLAPAIHADLSRSSLLVAHNAEFDYNFLNMEFQRVGLPALTVPYFCTMMEGVWATPHGKKPNLEELCWALSLPYDKKSAHSAVYDVEILTECLWKGIAWECFKMPLVEPMQMAA